MSKGKTLSLSTDMETGNANGCLTLQPNWCVSKLTLSSPTVSYSAKKASATIPIVFTSYADPVGDGIVSSLARPGGNITGLTSMSRDLDGKRLELLKESFPKVARVAFLWATAGTSGNLLTDLEATAKVLGVKLLSLEVRGIEDFEGALARADKVIK